jgi:hypothetical protein
MNIIGVTHAALVEAPIVQVPQMILTMHAHAEMVIQKEDHIQIRAIVTPQIAIHLVDITIHVLREQVVHLKVVGQMEVATLQTQTIQEVHLHNHLVGAIAEAVTQVLLLVVAVAQVAVAVVLVAEVAVGQDN